MISKNILKQYRYLLKEIPDLERRIKIIQNQLQKLESEGVVVDKVSGGQGGREHFKIEGFPIAKYSKKKTRLLFQMMRYEQIVSELSEIESDVCHFIDSIPDARSRMIFRFYYEDGMSQQSIAMKMNMDQCTVSRELEKYVN